MKFFYQVGAFGESDSWKTSLLNALAGKELFQYGKKLDCVVQARKWFTVYKDSPDIILNEEGGLIEERKPLLEAMRNVDIVLYCIQLSYYSNIRSQSFCSSVLPGLNYIAVLTGRNTADSPEELEDAWNDCIESYGLDKKRSLLIAPGKESDIDPVQVKKLKIMIAKAKKNS